jgi:hypothetical protein
MYSHIAVGAPVYICVFKIYLIRDIRNILLGAPGILPQAFETYNKESSHTSSLEDGEDGDDGS